MDDQLSFHNYVFTTCKKINNQFNVMLRFRKLISRDTLLRLYKAFILPHLNYCSSVWHFCGACQTEKMDCLNKRILRFIQKDYNSPCGMLLDKINSKPLYIIILNRCLHSYTI